MFVNIHGANESSSRNEDAASMLLGCHQRIRHFTEVALRLAEKSATPPAERATAAQSVLRYYTEALPFHEADENDSLHPRLQRVLPVGVLADANETMVRQHTEIDALVANLILEWRAMANNPSQENPSLLPRTQRLQELWTSHLQLEEEQVIPAMQKFLPAADLRSMEAEMRARRQR
ncbi:MAG TPA: hemerythrin domain-containing protein [Terriglobales bacterium]|jgi:hemerythrin-like domain-containing protein